MMLVEVQRLRFDYLTVDKNLAQVGRVCLDYRKARMRVVDVRRVRFEYLVELFRVRCDYWI